MAKRGDKRGKESHNNKLLIYSSWLPQERTRSTLPLVLFERTTSRSFRTRKTSGNLCALTLGTLDKQQPVLMHLVNKNVP